MAANLKQYLKSLIQQINSSRFHITRNIVEKSQDKISTLQYNILKKYTNIVKQLNSSKVDDIKPASVQSLPLLQKHIISYWQWYQEVTGLNKVDIAKEQVNVVQDKLFECQRQRRNLTQHIFLINGKLKEIYSELIQTKRDDSKYVQLTILENKNLQEHSRISKQLEILEDQERDNFTQLATAIKEYHDCQIMNNQKFKYLSIIASIILAILSVLGSMIYNHKIISEIRYVIVSGEKSIEINLNNKFLTLKNIIEQQNSSLNATNLQLIRLLDNDNEKSAINEMKNEKINDNDKSKSSISNSQINMLLKSEILKKTGYFIGFGCLSLYVLSKIFER